MLDTNGSALGSAVGELCGPALRACSSPLPTFFVIGPPRTGTSWLHEILKERALLPSPTKETRFFDVHFQRGIQWYLSHFGATKSTKPIGEIAPTYFASATACERIARVLPGARVVCTFRNPVDRVISLYRLKRAYGMSPWGLEEAISRDPELIESSRYATYLRLWQCAFGAKQVLATVYEDLQNDAQAYVDALADFIGLARFPLAPSIVRDLNTSRVLTHPRSYYRTRTATALADHLKARRLDFIVTGVRRSPLMKLFLGGGPAFAQLSLEFLHKLYDLFRPEVEELENMLNRDLSAWKSNQPALKPVQTAT